MLYQTNGSPVAGSRILSLLPRQGLMTCHHIQLSLPSHPAPPALLEALPWNWILSHHQGPVNQPFAGFVRLDIKMILQ